MSLAAHFVQMARNNAWSNLRLYGACRKLDPAALTAKRTSFFPTILSTLQHIWIVDEYYVDGLEGGHAGYAIFDREFEHTTIDALWSAQRSVDRRLRALCEGSPESWLDSPITLERPNGPQKDAARDVLAHLFVHQIHHRGQTHAMLSGTPIAPPQLDEWFLAMDRPIAEKELASVDQ
jgi:uncharacterized damage-inducible protein DinB